MDVDIVSLEGLHERFRHAVRLRTAHRGEAWHQAQSICKLDRLVSPVAAAIVREPLHRVRQGARSEAALDALQHQITDHLPADTTGGGAPGHDLPIAGVQGEGDPDNLAVPAGDLK